MSDKKYVVPRGMQIAFVEAMQKRFGGVPGGTAVGLEAAIRWLAENPVVPTNEQCSDMLNECYGTCNAFMAKVCREWQRRMFLAPEPEVPDAVKDLIDPSNSTSWQVSVLEAYNRGKAGK